MQKIVKLNIVKEKLFVPWRSCCLISPEWNMLVCRAALLFIQPASAATHYIRFFHSELDRYSHSGDQYTGKGVADNYMLISHWHNFNEIISEIYPYLRTLRRREIRKQIGSCDLNLIRRHIISPGNVCCCYILQGDISLIVAFCSTETLACDSQN
jgi:hypothetical protein